MSGKKKYKILICPLDWGLGHATRCVPIIRYLNDQGHTVIIGADNRPYDFLKGYFPDFKITRFPGISITYPGRGTMTMKMLRQLPGIFRGMGSEHSYLKTIVKDNNIDLVISDNRPGLWSDEVPTVYITHQLMIKIPRKVYFAEKLLHRLHLHYIRRFDSCWVPDLPGADNLSGDLAHKYPLPSNARFIGPLSRFSGWGKEKGSPVTGKYGPYDVLAVLSGPEPQRSLFEGLLMKQLEALDGTSALVRGLPDGGYKKERWGKVDIYNHLPDDELGSLLSNSKYLVTRSGYSTIMDLFALNRPAILVPTPGQTEQEYLAEYLAGTGHFVRSSQDSLQLEKLISTFSAAGNLPDVFNLNLLQIEISRLLP